MAYKKLFSEIKFGRLNLKNRIIFAPISTNLADANGNVTPELVYHYRRRAQGGASLITLENMCIIYPDAKNGATQPRIDEDGFIPGLSRISSSIHFFGSYASMELTHPGIFAENTGKRPLGPSSLNLRNDGIIPRELDENGITQIVEGFAGAARRAKTAGYDGVEIEAAHGLLVNQFLSPYTNVRKDKFGGSTENRLRIAEMIIRRIHDYCGRNFPVSARLPVMDNVQGGITIEEGVKIARGFEELGYCALHADFGLGDKEKRLEPMQYAEGWRIFLVKALKDGGVKVPVIAVGMIRNPTYASELRPAKTVR
ncbi:MAG: NADH:flavin oxidoreductase, partial [Nitrososphaeria archaeon]